MEYIELMALKELLTMSKSEELNGDVCSITLYDICLDPKF